MTSTLQALYSAVPGSLSTDIPTPFVDSFDTYTRTPQKSRGTLRPARLPMAFQSWNLQEEPPVRGKAPSAWRVQTDGHPVDGL